MNDDDTSLRGGEPGLDPGRESLNEFKAAQLKRAKDNVVAMRAEQSKEASQRRRIVGRARRSSNGDRTDWDEPMSFGDGIKELLATRGWEGELAVARVLAEWATVVGADISAHATPISLVGGVLTVQAESTAWATQLRLLTPRLIEAIAARFGAGVVTSITARGPAGPPTRAGQWKVRGGRGPRDTYG